MSYQIDKACDIITMALTIRLGKGGITDARTSQNSTYRSHREYHLMAGDSLVRRSLRQVTFLVSAIKPRKKSPRYCSTEGISVSTKMLELLNSPLLSHILYSIVKKQVDIL